MKRIYVFVLSVLILFGCSTQSRMLRATDGNLIDISQNDEEYEVMVLDPGFETWFITTWSPAKDRSEEYYASWNQQYVTEWNYKATRAQTAKFFNDMIQYDANERYGIDVERKLFYYFRWVETQLGIPILSNPPRAGL